MKKTVFAVLCSALFAAPADAQDIGPASDTARYVLDTSLLFVGGLAGMLILIGFCMRDVGLARTQHAPSICLRTIGGFGVCAFAFWLTGFNLIYLIEDGGLLGAFQIWAPVDDDPLGAGRAASAFWFFQMTLAAIGAAIVAGAISERAKLWPFLIFAAAYSGLIYPIVASWVWGGGYLAESWSFYDYGGAAAVHMTAGATALAAALVVGPRPGKYAPNAPRIVPTTALPLSVFGIGLVVIGVVVSLAAQGRSLSSVEAAISISNIAVNSVLASAAGVLAAIFLTQIVYKRAGVVTGLSGLVGGLVSISGDPLHPALWQAAMIGAVGGVIVTVAPPFLDRLRIDDAVFVIPAHLLCGAWGAAMVAWTNDNAWFVGQFVGVAGIGVFAFFLSLLFWVALKYTIGVRLAPPEEQTQSG